MRKFALLATLACVGGSAFAQVFPTGPHAANNFIPFGAGVAGGNPTMHQVFASSLFAGLFGGQPVRITQIAFAPGVDGAFDLGQVDINLGYTNAIPGVASGAGGLVIPTVGGGGNNVGAMSSFFSGGAAFNFTAQSPSNFQMTFNGLFDYDPSQGNLLAEIIVPSETNLTLTVSRAAGSAEASRSFSGMRFAAAESPTTATRMQFRTSPVPEPATFAALGLGALALMRRRRNKAA
ncbi:MAG: PEP-CTERM sorting domain-containing protein [Fimbriimonadaceae bacterium]